MKQAKTDSDEGMIRELLDHDPEGGDRRLSAWEIEFVESLDRQPQLSDKQSVKLTEVWKGVFS